MEIVEAKSEVVKLRTELAENEAEYKKLNKIYNETRVKMNLCINKKKELSTQIKKLETIIEAEDVFETVQGTEGFDTLLQSELVAISDGMDKTDYRKYGNYPRWYDLKRLVKEVIMFKQLYPCWILQSLTIRGQYDTLPPKSFYIYTYKSQHGHSMSVESDGAFDS